MIEILNQLKLDTAPYESALHISIFPTPAISRAGGSAQPTTTAPEIKI